MKITITSFLILFASSLFAQNPVTTFEDLTLAPESYWISSANSDKYFISNGDYFPSNWDTSFGGYWGGGFAYSNMTDSVTSGYLNAFSAKAGSGHESSTNYAVAYDDGYFLPGQEHGNVFTEIWITNSTFAYNNMRDGDAVGKKFGGVTGNDPDFLSVTFTGYFNGLQSGVPYTFFLADFRNPDNSQDYIIREWTSVNLAGLSFADSVSYTFASSDTGDFGINTPKYFCMDNLAMNTVLIGIDDVSSELKLYPNPTAGMLTINADFHPKEIRIFDLSGKLVTSQELISNNIDISFLGNGIYFTEIYSGNKKSVSRIVLNR